MSAAPHSAAVEPKELDRDTLQDVLNGPLALLERIFKSAGSGGEFVPDAEAWFGLARLVEHIREDVDHILEQDVAFDEQEEARRKIGVKGRGAR